MSYEDTLAAEKKIYENNVAIHDLPPIFHYWSNQHLLPKFQSFGFNSLNEMFLTQLEKACVSTPPASRVLARGTAISRLSLRRR